VADATLQNSGSLIEAAHQLVVEALWNNKADLFSLANRSGEAGKIQVLNKNTDLKQLFILLEDFKDKQLAGAESAGMKASINDILNGEGKERGLFNIIIESAIREGRLDDGVIDIEARQLSFVKEKVDLIGGLALDAIRSLALIKNPDAVHLENFEASPNPVYHEAMNRLKDTHTQDPTKTAAVVRTIAFYMAVDYPNKKNEIIAQVPEVIGPVSLYAFQEGSAQTQSEQGALPYIKEKLGTMVLENSPAIVNLNNHFNDALLAMADTKRVVVESEIT
jgi:hypothetical protein